MSNKPKVKKKKTDSKTHKTGQKPTVVTSPLYNTDVGAEYMSIVVTGQDVLRKKNTLADRILKEGIEGRPSNIAAIRAIWITVLARELEREDCLERARAWLETLDQRDDILDDLKVMLDFSRANAIAANRWDTAWQWEQATLAREIFYLRHAISNPNFFRIPDVDRCMILNNLGNRLRVAGRIIESLEYWRQVLKVEPNFGMALCNRALGFANYAEALEDNNERGLFLFVAHKEASAAVANNAVYTHQLDKPNLDMAKSLKAQIESVINVEGLAALNSLLTLQDTSVTEEEDNYHQWSLTNRLYLNPLNDLGPYAVAGIDSLELAVHIVPVDAPHTFETFFEQMKQEYVSARWMLYEGLSAKRPHFSDKNVPLHATEPLPTLSLAIEKVKAAYRTAYSIFDKVGFFLNAYMGLAIPERRVSFRTLWRPDKNKPIRSEFDQTGNWGFCALYWLGKDFFEVENDEVAEPQARHLSDIRNFLEHRYLRITANEPAAKPPDDLAMMVSREQFEAKALHLLRLARSALIYLSIGVGLEERRREPDRAGMPIEEIPPTPYLLDDEKI